MPYGVDPTARVLTPQTALGFLAAGRVRAQREREFEQGLAFQRETTEEVESFRRAQLAEQRAARIYGAREGMRRLRFGEEATTERAGITQAGALERAEVTQVGVMGRAAITEAGRVKKATLTEAGRVERAEVTATAKKLTEAKRGVEDERKFLNKMRRDLTNITRKRTSAEQIEQGSPTGEMFYGVPKSRAGVSGTQQRKDKNFIIGLGRGLMDGQTEDEIYQVAIDEGINLSNSAVDQAIQKWATKTQKQEQEERAGEPITPVGRLSLGKRRLKAYAYTGYTQEQENLIHENMIQHGKNRSEIIVALKKRGYL